MKKPAILGLIPARGGSKGVPRKNIRLLGGKPLIAHTIEAALASPSLGQVAVSTEDAEIAAVAANFGSLVVHRPPELAEDATPTLPVMQHAITHLERENGRSFDYIVLMQATTPFRNSEDIEGTVAKLIETGADCVVTVRQVTELHPWKFKKIVDDRLVDYAEQEVAGTRRQDLPACYVRNGGIYASRRGVVMKDNSIYGQDVRAFVMPEERSIDINSPLDFVLAEALLERGLVGGQSRARPRSG